MHTHAPREGEGRLLQVSAGFMTINLNGWFSKEKPTTSHQGSNRARYQALWAAVKRHNLSVVGVQEHHWRSFVEMQEAQQWLLRKGWGVQGVVASKRGGVALLWKNADWKEVWSCALQPRLLLVGLQHVMGDVLVFFVGHFHGEPADRQRQWELLEKVVRERGWTIDVSLCDHNSVLHAGATSRWNGAMRWGEERAMEVEVAAQSQLLLVDGWDFFYEDATECPGYTHDYRRGDLVVQRRIDRILVSRYITSSLASIYTMPVGFADHQAVVLWIRDEVEAEGLGKGRWKFNLEALDSAAFVDSMATEFGRVTGTSFQGWEEGLSVLREHSVQFSRKHSQRGPLWRELFWAVRQSTKEYVPRSGWALLSKLGVVCDSMASAYRGLVKALMQEERRVHTELGVESLRSEILSKEFSKEGQRHRQKAVYRLLQELSEKRALTVVQNRQGRLVRGAVNIAQTLKEFWETVTPGNLPTKSECSQWLACLGLPARWRSMYRALVRPCSREVVEVALGRMHGSAAPGEDGIWAKCYQTFPEFFVPKMLEIVEGLEGGEDLPEGWTVACVRPIPKRPGALRPEDQRPIALQQCKTKWLMTVFLVQIEDVMAQLVPPQQKAYLKGRCMEDHLFSVMADWETPPVRGMGEVWVAVDYTKAYDSINHALVEALLMFIGMARFMIRVCLSVMKGGIHFLVGRQVVSEVVLHPKSGIRQGDPLSPVIFVLVTVLLLFVKRRTDCSFWLYSDDVLLKVSGKPEELHARVGGVLDNIREFGRFTGLRLNASKTEVLLRGAPPGVDWHGLRVVQHLRYLGGYIGDVAPEVSFAPAMTKVRSRCLWLVTSPFSVEEKKLLIHTWVLPCIRVPSLLRSAPRSVRVGVKAAISMALGVKPWKLSLEILCLPPEKGGVGLVVVDVYFDWLLARTLWRWMNDESFLSHRANAAFREWLLKRGIILSRPQLPLLILAGTSTVDVPWLAHAVEAWSRLMVRLPGFSLPPMHVGDIPLWHSKAFMCGGRSRACRSLLDSGILRLGDLGTTLSLRPEWQRVNWLTKNVFELYQSQLAKIAGAVAAGEGVRREGALLREESLLSPFIMSANVMEGSKQEERQPEGVWRAFKKVRLPGADKDFVRQALWKKLAVGSRMHAIFPDVSPRCPFDNEREDHHHRFKTCLFLQNAVHILRTSWPPLHVGGVFYEVGRLCVDELLLSLRTPQGLVMWKVVRSLWAYRCDVIFRKVAILETVFFQKLVEGLKFWLWSEEVGVPKIFLYSAVRGLLLALRSPVADHLTCRRVISEPVVSCRKRSREGEVLSFKGGGQQGCQVLKRVFTDGSFAREAAGIGFAGWGVFVEGEGTLKKSEPLEGERQTNNRAELMAVIWAFENLPQEWALSIVTDSQYVLLGLRVWLPRWKLSGWRVAGARPVENRDLWERLESASSARLCPWTLFWTRGHVGLVGNETADQLANEGRLKHPGRLRFLARGSSTSACHPI